MIPNKLRIPAWFFLAATAVFWIPTGPAAAASAPQVQTPSAPLNLTATASGSIVDLAWQAPTSGSPITRYEVEVSANAGVSWRLSRERGRQRDHLYAPGPPDGCHAPLPGEGAERPWLGYAGGRGRHHGGREDAYGALESHGDHHRLDRRPRLGRPVMGRRQIDHPL